MRDHEEKIIISSCNQKYYLAATLELTDNSRKGVEEQRFDNFNFER